MDIITHSDVARFFQFLDGIEHNLQSLTEAVEAVATEVKLLREGQPADMRQEVPV